jgi:hypothetical protein
MIGLLPAAWEPEDTKAGGIDGTLPQSHSEMLNVVTLLESGGGRYAGKPIVRTAELSSREKKTQEANASSRKRNRNT